MAQVDGEQTRFSEWPDESVNGGYHVCHLLGTSPTIRGAAREVLTEVTQELVDELHRRNVQGHETPR